MRKRDVLIGLGIAIILAICSFLASRSPDGLERVAEDMHFIIKSTSVLRSPVPDYIFPGITNEKLAGSLAGIAGVLIVFLLGSGLAKLIKKDK